ncbi:MAG TPA: urea ABC transporter permease subunit UrtB [Accumulibacter sp.]|uniref:urea ABC transporter permease subunit UrtB n=1 Tax=Accumulibacter sp. TaxID=2053492 RepID=UPI0025D1CB94|nr:urea ABC transporter permease subunit UrtB [Accumulibacter sp.]MCM8597234.1 urea ABC transporter permease subunit UrtB [Accumulibacter sp.]MCM8661523.1 urea ABC transporter permease subunit UrtB [Accumulibacter sp.]HNC52641.1 urea ABC transporter permease subunit UrtB [Accumulibacter sp.]
MRTIGLLFCGWLLSASCLAAIDPVLLKPLAAEDSDTRIAAIAALAEAAPEEALPILQALSEGSLAIAGERMVIVDGRRVLDAASNAEIKPAPGTIETIGINNRVRRELSAAMAALRLFSAERAVRWQAAQEVTASADAKMLPLLDRALASETDGEIRSRLQMAHAQASLGSTDAEVRLAAVRVLGESSDPRVKQLLLPLTEKRGDGWVEPDGAVRAAAGTSIRAIEQRLAWAENLGRAFTGLSLGSILLLAALGLAITYGVMGVINMAHGELLMVGAYSAWVMQSVFRAYFPEAIDWYLLAAVPVGFLAAALVGVLMERIVIRHLYGRPLETLLATWGISLFLMQVARTLFGAQNVEVANPAWLAGGIEVLPNLLLPWNRIIIVAFSIAVLSAMWAILNLSRLGMFVRAVTQNRPMAGCVGVPTGRIDTLAFGLGAGIAGLGGVALSQIANVGPDMGQGYIVDSFMVVVLGGVGQLAGAVWAALGLGVFTKFLEGWTGAVVAKIVVLVFIIIFIQKRPQGLFAVKGRFVES